MKTERTSTDYIAIHCSATPPDMDIGVNEIREWHIQRGWQDVGYNIVIRRSGRVEIGRPLNARGAHVAGYNDRALGVCLVGGVGHDNHGEANFTKAQMNSLWLTLGWLELVYPDAVVQGHRDFPNVQKDCPCFDVSMWMEGRRAA